MSRFRFIDAEKTNHPVRMMCRLLNVSSSGFYDWLGRGPSAREVSNMALTATIRAIHRDSNDVYGSPRVHAELVAVHGMAVSPKRVAALMAAAGLVGVHRRRRRGLTKQDKKAPPAPDLVGRRFTAVMPGIKMVGDITCLPTRQGWLYLASVIDLCTRKLVGYAMAEHMRAELVVGAITMAATHNQLAGGAIFHSDRGSQYTSKVFRDALTDLDLRASMGRVGSCFDNAVAESWFATLKTEIGTTIWATRELARADVFAFIQRYNRNRRHSTLNYLTPEEAELRYRHELPLAA
ncbi:MAG TPA: IS3 family transposase [Dermatophilaceae bacterium]